MKRFKNILVVPSVPSEDDAALQRALKLADSNAARLTVFWPIEENSDSGTGLDYVPEIIQAVSEHVDEALEPVRQRGGQIETKVRAGRAFVEIIKQVNEGGHDLVLKTARGRDIQKSMLFGTTALHLLRKCPCPVWIVNPNPGKRKGVLAAIDTGTADDQAAAINRTILELATSMSILENTMLHVVHAWSVPYEDMIQNSPWLRWSRQNSPNQIEEIQAKSRARFDTLIGGFTHFVPKMECHFVKGSPTGVIPKIAQEKGIELVVMATLGRTGIPGLFIGNTAESVLSQIDCSALTIKPDGFVSPVAA